MDRTGSLFRQKAHAKSMRDGNKHYEYSAFHYTHRNPLVANLVKNLKDWPYSSFLDYARLRDGSLCDKELAFQLIAFNKINFIEETLREINEKQASNLFNRML